MKNSLLFKRLFYLHFQILLGLSFASATPSEIAGSLAGQFEVSQSGSATYNIPINVPPGTAGMEPSLGLSYDSGGPSGLMGPGWGLSGLSAITRCPATLAQDGYIRGIEFDHTDRFCMDGQRLVAINGAYGGNGTEYRTNIESFAKIVSYGHEPLTNGPEYFVAHLKNGLIYEFGKTMDARHTSGGYSLSWNVNRVTDRSNNYYTVYYAKDDSWGESRAVSIDYTGNSATGLAPYNSITIEYTERTKHDIRLVFGLRFVTRHKISRINVRQGGQTLWHYDMGYENESVTEEDRVVSIEQCDAQGICLPKSEFAWGPVEAEAHQFSTRNTLPGLGTPTYQNDTVHPLIHGDWNCDGKMDIARVSNTGINVFVSTGDGFVQTSTLNDFSPQQGYSGSLEIGGEEFPIFVGDWNGDGCTDIGRVGQSQVKFKLSDKQGGFIDGIAPLNDLSPQQGYPRAEHSPLLTGDWNGDGRTDIARFYQGGSYYSDPSKIQFYSSQGSSFQALYELYDAPLPSPGGSDGMNGSSAFTGDWNGDGLTDIGFIGDGTGYYYFYVSQGTEFDPCYHGGTNYNYCVETHFEPGVGFGEVDAFLIGDWNGDGLTDFGKLGWNHLKVCLMNGFGRLANCYTTSTLSLSQTELLGKYPIFTGDWNNDGKTDIAQVTESKVRIFLASSNPPSQYITFLEVDSLYEISPVHGFNSVDTRPLVVSDFNGDGFTDIGRVNANDFIFFNHIPSETDRIVRFTNGHGKYVAVTYAPLTDLSVYSKESGAVYPRVDLTPPTSVVKHASTSNGIDGERITSYHYTGLHYDALRRSAEGFRMVEATDQETGIRTKTTYLENHPYYAGMAHKRETFLSDGTLIDYKQDDWSSILLGSGSSQRSFIYVNQSIEQKYEIDGSFVSGKTIFKDFDAWGNLIQSETVWSDGSSELTVNTFQNDPSEWLLGQLETSTVTKVGAGNPTPPSITKRVAFNYLQSTGLLDSEVVEPGNPTLELTKTYQYDLFGNIIQKTIDGVGIQSRTETTVYDSRGQFPVSITNTLGQTESRVTDPKFGKLTSLTGPNGITTIWQFDSFGRTKRQLRADGTETATYYELPSTGAPINAAYQVRESSTGVPDVITYSDEHAREIRKVATGFIGQKIFIDKVYDEQGYLTHVSDPYFENETPKWTVTEYDAIGRAITITQPGNRTTHTTYAGLTTTIVNPLNQVAIQTVDAQGFVLSATDNQGNILSFRNDSYGNPLEIKDPFNNTTIIEYDQQGKKTRLIDPDTGTTTYTYSSLGELLTRTDALNQTTTYSYDLLGRLVQRSSSDGTEYWQYDTATNGVGKLSQVTGLNGYSESYTYDSLGRLFKTTTNVGGKSFVTSQTYDLLGRVDTYIYPSLFTLKNIYNSFGYLSEIQRTDLNTTVWKPNSFNAKGQLEQQTFGNGLLTHKTYDPNTGFMTSAQTTGIQDLTFVYDALGNLTERQDLKVGAKENFTYDSLNRLVTATVLGQSPVTVNYDPLGNITSRSDVGTYVYGVGAGPHAVTSITGPKANNYTYDQVGNRISSDDATIQYSVSGKPISITKGTKRVEFDLDPKDQRIEERIFSNNILTESKVYIGSLYESSTKSGNTTGTHYIKGVDGLVAVVTTTAREFEGIFTGSGGIGGGSGTGPLTPKFTSTIRYLHLDHLGSIQTISDVSGSVVEVLSFDPWGQRRDAATWTPASNVTSSVDRGFTGHEHLDEVGLIHMNGRVYDPVIGRFISADPFIQSPQDLQSYNRYSYVLNNPLSLTDPTGYFFKKLFKSFKAMLKNPKSLAIFVASLSTGFMATTSLTAFATCNVSGAAVFSGMAASTITGAATAFGGLVSSFTASLLSGGDLVSSFRSGIIGALTAGVTTGMNELIDGSLPHYLKTGVPKGAESGSILSEILSAKRITSQIPRFLSRGVFRGSLSYVLGGKFDAGFSYSLGADFTDMTYSMLNEYAGRWEFNRANRLPWQTGPDLEYLHSTLNTALKPAQAFRGTSLANGAPFVNTTGSANEFLGDWRGERGLIGWFGLNVPTVNGLSLLHDNAMGPSMFNIPTNSQATWWQDAFNMGTIAPTWFYNAAGAGLNGAMYEQSLILK